ncbi:similar to Saccharomyces cerevisiae YPL092W SSU1 Plasma membrane sulfite pump involved in sulfite metabolism and required for efficient sulfite efflux [Maudiozyma barnettii]|uniref:Similar to Saccharomyces cerevisiae YPL092W SSU1 Plasma membrane sulfite pump involved in sulfite metabolism and required for efficient sulfite efflux n=1 Tax=Maudiozyma barnettii TaxID=61262 RepID=A0A8H2VI65_9SACH|nr:Ssu1p [Kazachstania barnettii]CAB4255793.1 similar to Saccharomyces cerevisiae YPL092W SSU1 Plasma membrane sulfite pump involved in sulfite metabolism and required for efficient sulfite efflux [Kazachstania barnettii]CAD1784354.1 similar to Saccharomyces cerevisiae YPL092W SSU1 Plasma membrane sulfite pump involved in sulfite metabolism and required for efficient sulfite efflux [Kazachstania barnettii]
MKKTIQKVVWHFEPFSFVMVMGTGIASDILYSFPYPARWLRICSYILFAIACLLFIFLQLFACIHMFWYARRYSWHRYFNHYYRNLMHNVFWGTYPMGLVTIINYLTNLTETPSIISENNAKRLMIFIYLLWWYDITISMLTAWGISFLIWQDYYYTEDWANKYPVGTDRQKIATQNLKSTLLMNVIPLVVGTASGALFTMTNIFTITFNRNIQLLTMVICILLWLHAILFVGILVTLFFWNLYVNKLPKMQQVFTMFLVLGPLGQGAFGILLMTNNIKTYVDLYYPAITSIQAPKGSETALLTLLIPWCFKIFGLITSLALLGMGYFFTIITFVAIFSYLPVKEESTTPTTNKKITMLTFHKGFWAMTFPMGTMALGTNEVWKQYGQFVPIGAFRVVAAIYSVLCVVWVIVCLMGSIYTKCIPYLKHQWNRQHRHSQNEVCDEESLRKDEDDDQLDSMGSANEIDGSDDNASEATIGIRESDSVIELATMATRTQ